MQKDLIFINLNFYTYAINNPIYYIDPFGLLPPSIGRFFWVMLFLPSPGGGIWFSSRCDMPASENDCFNYCSGREACRWCCAYIYRDDLEAKQNCQYMCQFAYTY